MKRLLFFFISVMLICLSFNGCAEASKSVSEGSGAAEESDVAEELGAEEAAGTAGEADTEDEADTVEESDTGQETEELQDIMVAERTRLEDEPYYHEYYTGYIETFPDAVYPAEEWFSQDGVLAFPFSRQELNSPDLGAWERIAMFHVPQEAMDAASTGELLNIWKRIWMIRADLYNNPSDYLGYLSASFNVTNECLRREDLAETVLAAYKSDQFMPRMDTGGKKNADYNVACRRQESAIILEEIILATDLAFDQMDDAMRRETLEVVEEKRRLREKGTFECSASKGGFYTYIGEMLTFDHSSKWYDYICGQVPENEQMLAHIDNYLWDWIH